MLRNKWIVIFLSCFGCTGTQSFPVEIQLDETFSSQEIKTIEQSLMQWRDATGIVSYQLALNYPHDFDFDRDYHRSDDLKVMYKLSNEEWSLYCDAGDFCNTLGMTARNAVSAVATTIILKYESLDSVDFHKATLHELGHFFGITEHSEYTDCVMYGGLSTPEALPAGRECVDQESLEMFCDLYDCNVARGACPNAP